MRPEKDIQRELETTDKLIESLRHILSEESIVPKVQKSTSHYYVSQYYLKGKLSSGDYKLLTHTSQLDYLQGLKDGLKFVLKVAPYERQIEISEAIKNDSANPVPQELRVILNGYSGIHRARITQIAASLWNAYAKDNKKEIIKLLEELSIYIDTTKLKRSKIKCLK